MTEASCFPGSHCLVELKEWARYYAITLRWNIWEKLNNLLTPKILLGLNSRVGSSAMNAEPEQPGRSRGIHDSRWFELSKGWSLHAEVLFLLLVRTRHSCVPEQVCRSHFLSGRLNVMWVLLPSLIWLCLQTASCCHSSEDAILMNPAVSVQHHTDDVVSSASFQTRTSLFAFRLYLSQWQMLL